MDYRITDFGAVPGLAELQTEKIQKVFDLCRENGVPLIIGQFLADDSTEPKTMQPSIGGYQTWSRAANAYNGDIGEVIAFDHEITEDEKKAVEQYLSAPRFIDA